MITFIRNLVSVKADKAVTNAVEAIVRWDPQSATEAELRSMEQHLDVLGRQVAEARMAFDNAALIELLNENAASKRRGWPAGVCARFPDEVVAADRGEAGVERRLLPVARASARQRVSVGAGASCRVCLALARSAPGEGTPCQEGDRQRRERRGRSGKDRHARVPSLVVIHRP